MTLLYIRQWSHLMAILFSALLLNGCQQHKLPELKQGAVILAFGDSLTVGYGVNKEQSYPSILGQLSAFKVINAGVSGETTALGLKRLEAVLEKHQPQLLILFEGGNDILQKVPLETIQQNLAQMIELAQAKHISVLLIGIPEKKLFGDTEPLYEELADLYKIPLEGDIVATLMTRASMKSDFVHFNALGYQTLAEAIYKTLQNSGALPGS
jgi:acyl-CoA thioesterase-1